MLKFDVGWLKGLLLPFFKVTIIHMHATLNIAHISPTHISQASLVSEWCKKASLLLLQLWMLEALKMSREGFVILWRPELL